MEKEKIYQTISSWTKEAGTMLPKSEGEISAFLESGNAVVVWNGDGTPAGFAAITFAWPDNWYELGGLVVEPGHREKGLGHDLVGQLIEKAKETYPDGNFFALCNERSLKIFLDKGAQIIEDPNLLPEEVWGECLNCPMRLIAVKKGQLCCDTPVQIK